MKNFSYSEIVKTSEPRVEVLASPGSGKTHTLIQRIQHLIASGVPPKQILVLTFSNAAVCELRRRMDKLSTTKDLKISMSSKNKRAFVNADLSDVPVLTAHKFGLGLIRKKQPNVQILEDKQAQKLLAKAIRSVRQGCRKKTLWPDVSMKLRHKRETQLDELLDPQQIKLVLNILTVARLSKLKIAEATLTTQFESLHRYLKVLRVVRKKFTALKREKGVLDYTDMLVKATRVIESTHIPFTHILVDEYQDCSAAQVRLLTALAELEGRSIMVFGDKNQAIFGFSGSNYTPLSDFLSDVQEMNLSLSWRLTPPLATLASAVAQHTPEQAIQTKSDGGTLPVLIQNTSLMGQTKSVVNRILKLIAGGVSPDKIVVLARTNALLQPVEQLLLAHHVDTHRLGIKRDVNHALKALELVELVEKRQDKFSEKKVLHEWMPDVKLKAHKQEQEVRALKKVFPHLSLESKYRLCAAIYLRLKGGVRKDSERRADVNRWEPLCRGSSDAKAMRSVIKKTQSTVVVTGTIHSAKGGEWDHVFIVGVSDGLLPLYLEQDEESLPEERNLLYVAITRACKTVRLYCAPTPHARSRQTFKEVSRFLAEGNVCQALQIRQSSTH